MATKKNTRKKGKPQKSLLKNALIVNIVDDAIVKDSTDGTKNISATNVSDKIKIYPPIYTYIYEREPEDMAKIYGEHKDVNYPNKRVTQITGFKTVNGKLVAIKKAAKSKK